MDYLLPLADVTTTSGFLGSFLTKSLKTNQLEVNTDEKTLRPIARLKEPRELFALPKEKDYDCAQQAPRWPIECQVVEERIEHIPNVPETPEPYYQPNGNELKPRPVGEENGIVVYNYNPISAVNYDKCKKSSKKFKNLDDDSSDSDASSCDSRGSSPDIHTKPQVSNSISKLLPTLEAESSSNSNDDDDSDENDDDRPKGYRLNFLGNENNGDIEDKWANKSPEYVAVTHTYTKSQFGKTVKKSKAKPQEGVMDCKGLHVVSPIKLDEKLASQLNINLVRSSSSSLSTNSDEPTEDGEVDADEDHMYQAEEVTAADTLLISQVPETSFNVMLGSSEINIKTEASLNPNPNSDRTCPAPNTDPLATTVSGSVSLTSTSPAPMPQPNLSSADNSWSSQEQNNAPSTNNYNNSTQDNQGNAQQSNKTFYPPQFSRSAVSGSKIITNCHPHNPDEYDGLEFESRFESGNLAKAIQITPTYYELYLRPDLYTSRSKQWFYFRVRRTKKNMIYRFSIVNLVKSNSLYNDGMRPLMYSTTDAKTIGVGWKRCGDNICYYCNEDENQPCSDDELDNNSYTLTFNVEFSHDNDVVYFSHSYPYTYSDLQDYLMAMQKDPLKSKFCKLRLLCRTLAGNNVYYLTITAPTSSEEVNRRKKSIVISARVHPSETPSSWMMKGLMDFITADTAVAKRLRHKFIFKLIPMLNPDGVIVGNTRNSLTGKDLNRQYRTVIRETYPSIWYTKALIKRLIDESGVSIYCDMHAHSRCHNIFIYGCENKRNPEKKLTEQVFPLMLHKNASDKFSFENCKFKIQRSKEGTGRIVVWMLGITNSYTLEASFGGSTLGSRKGTHFNIVDYEQIGRAFCETLLDYSDENPAKQCLRLKIIERLLKEGSSAEEPINIPLSDYSSDEGSCSSTDEGKTNNSFSDLEGPCCLPIRAPPCSPDLKLDMTKISEQQRIFRYSRMRKIMQELDRIYFQPLFHKKARFLMKNKRPSAKPRQKRKGKKSDENRNQKGSKPNTPRNKDCQNKELKPDNNDKVKTKSLSFGDDLNNQNGPKNAQMAVTLRSVKNCEINSNEVIVKEPQSLIENQEVTANETVSKKRLRGGREVNLAKHKPHVKISRKLRLWLAKRQIIIIRRRTPRKIKLQWKAIRILNYHKKDERQILDIPTTDPGSDLVFSTDDEFVIDNNNAGNPNCNTLPRIRRNLLQSDLQRRYIEEIGDGFQRMPPELIITSPINSLAIKYKVRPSIKVQKIFQFPTVNETTRRTLSWHNLHTEQRHSPKCKNNNSPQINLLEAKREALRKEDLNIQLSLKKKIWAGIQPEGILNAIDRTKPLMRLTSSAKTEQQNPKHTSKKSDDIAGSGQQLNITTNGPQDKDHTRKTDVFLRTCSRKLVQWQLTNSGNMPINILEEKKIPLDAAVPEINESQTMRIFRHIVNSKKAQKTANKIKTESHGNERKSKIKRNSSTKNFERMKNVHKPTKSKSHTSLISMALETKNSSPHIRASSSGNLKRNLLQMTALSTPNKNLGVRSKKSKKTKTQSTASRKINEVLPTTTKATIKGLPSTTYEYAQHNSNFVKTVNSTTLMRKIKTKLKKKKLPILNCSNHLQLTGSSTAITT